MKFSIKILALWIATAAAPLWAQTASGWQLGKEVKRFDAGLLAGAAYAGVHGQADCWLLDGGRHGIGLALTDGNLHEAARAMLPHSGRYTLLSAARTGSHIRLLLVDDHSRHKAMVGVASLSLDTMEFSDPVPVVQAELGHGDRFHAWGATSPSGRWSAVVTAVEHSDRGDYEATVALLDEAMHVVWQREYALGTLDQVAVSDEGRIVTLGCEQSGLQAELVYNVFSAGSASTMRFGARAGCLSGLRLVSVEGGHALAMGMFSPAHLKGGEALCAGVYAVSVSFDSASITGEVVRRLTDDDMRALYGLQPDDSVGLRVADRTEPQAWLPMPYGGVVALERMFAASHEDGKEEASGSLHCRVGMHLVAVDTCGRLLWARSLPGGSWQRGNGEGMQSLVAGVGERVLVVKHEPPQAAQILSKGRGAQMAEVGAKTCLAAYLLGRDGTAQRTVVDNRTKETIVAAYAREGEGAALITGNGKKGSRSILNIK